MFKKLIIFFLILVSFLFISNLALAQFGLENFSNDSDNAFFSANQSVPETTARIISVIIGVVGVLFLVLLIYGGVLYATSAGDTDRIESGKKVLTYSVIGIVIVALSFAITNYVLVGLFSDGGTSQGQGQSQSTDGGSSTATGGSSDAAEGGQTTTGELLSEGELLIQEGKDMINRGEEMSRRGQELIDSGGSANIEAGEILLDDGLELINGGNARVEEGEAIISESGGLSGGGGNGSNRSSGTSAEVDVDCNEFGERCGVFRDFCCSYLECDGALFDSGWPRVAGECAYGNPECKEEGERCVPFGQECCSGTSCIEGYCEAE